MTTNEKNAAISRMIVDRVAAGEELSAAIDAVLGAGTHAAIVDDVYRAIVARNVLEHWGLRGLQRRLMVVAVHALLEARLSPPPCGLPDEDWGNEGGRGK